MIILSGKVIKGQKYGRTLGYPTANLDRRQYARQNLKIRFGVWAGEVKIRNQKSEIRNYKAGIVVGPSDKSGLPKIEAHLLNFKGNLYGKKIVVILKKYLRPFKKFKNITALKLQIQKDLRKTKLT